MLGATALRVDAGARFAIVQGAEGREVARIRKGDIVSIDGRTGGVWLGSRSLLEVPAADASE